MRILVVGASGYVGGRAIPVLLDAGHDIVATARTPSSLDRFWWREHVTVRTVDVLDRDAVYAAVTPGIDALLYLVHGLAGSDFRSTDRRAAFIVRAAADRAGVGRIVYVSGIIPDIPVLRLSEHLRSRLEVEQILGRTRGTAITLRAAMIVGAGSTSYAVMSQLARRLPVTVLPEWMNHRVEPLAVTDLTAAIRGAFTTAEGSRHYDVGGGERLAYPDLIARYLTANGLERPSMRVPLLPQRIVGELASRVSDVPDATVRALIESLREDMVAADRAWIGDLVDPSYVPVGIAEALRRSEVPVDHLVAPSERDPVQSLPGDPAWADPRV